MCTRKVPAILVSVVFLLGAVRTDARTKSKLGANELSMNVVDGYFIVVKASIGNLHGLSFLLDTGATTTAIDRKLAQHLRLATHATQMVNFDKTLQVDWCILPELTIGPERATNLKVAIEDLRYLRASGVDVDGVIGWDLLRRHSFRLDFGNKRIVFGTVPATDGQRAGHSVPFRESSLCLTVPIDLDGRQLWMVADTGMRGAMFYEPQLQATSYQRQATISGRAVGGNLDSEVALLPRLRIANQDLDRQAYVVHRPNSNLLDGIAGYLGIVTLNAKQVTFDLDRGVLSWQ